MSRLTAAYGVAMGTILATATYREGSSPWPRQHSLAADTCSVETLGRAAAVDTAQLRRVKRESAPGKSAEGGETMIYYQGDRPRVIVIVYYGETGRTVVHYYLAAPDQFVAEQEVIDYAEPISMRARPAIASRRPSTLYVCGETLKDPVSAEELRQIRSDLRAALSPPVRSR
jgi:hypothetical protein